MSPRIFAVVLLLAGGAVGWWIYQSETTTPFNFGLDLAGGTHLVYEADTSLVAGGDITASMDALRSVIERRVNIFGVSEPLVQVETGGIGAAGAHRLIVELPGVTNLEDAIRSIGETPLLEFKLVAPATQTASSTYVVTGLTGQYLSNAQLQFGAGGAGGINNQPVILLTFNTEGAVKFKEITEKNIGTQLAIFLDGASISEPVIQEAIPNGQATITGSFTPESARDLVKNLNFGALPVPIALASSQTVGASLGTDALMASLYAGIIGFVLVSIFLIAWYRLPGVVSVIALLMYVIISLALFKLIPVTLTVAGLAAFILSLGMAVDANILIFERTREELSRGKLLKEAVEEGFQRAWTSIRDSNLSSILTGIILFWLGGTAIIKGFALVFVLGVLISMFTATTVTRTLLLAIGIHNDSKLARLLFMSGFSKTPTN